MKKLISIFLVFCQLWLPLALTAQTNIRANNVTAKKLENIRFVDSSNSQGWAGSDPGAWINAAAADAGNFGTVVLAPVAGGTYPAITTALMLPRGLTLKFPPGVFQIVGGTSISNIGVTILGSGRQSTYLEPTSATGNIFTIATGGANFEIGNLAILAAVPRTSGATFSINDGLCFFHDLYLQDMFDGFVQNAGSTTNTFQNVAVVSTGGNWHNVFKNAPLASGTIPGTVIESMTIVLTGATVTGDAVVFDSGTDSTKINGLEISKLTGVDSNVGLRIQSTGAAQIPSYMEISNSYSEVNATSIAVQIDNAQIPVFSNFGAAAGLVGLKITGGKGIRFVNSFFNSTQQGAIQITGGSDMTITGNAITDCARAGANTYDAIAVSAGVTGFNISNNRIGTFLFASQTYKNGISVAAGSSNNYVIEGNTIDGVSGVAIFDSGTGANKRVESPLTNFQGFTGAITGTGAAANIYSITVVGGSVPVNRGIRVRWAGSHSTGTANVTLTITLNGVTIATGTSGTAASQPLEQDIVIMQSGTTTASISGVTMNGNAMAPVGASLGGFAWGSNQTLLIQFNVANTDAVTGFHALVEAIQ